MKKLQDIINVDNEVVSIIGSGGKTSFMMLLALSNVDKKVMISTTTKIYSPDNIEVVFGYKECLNHVSHKGLQCLGCLNRKTDKIESLPLDVLSKIVLNYDIVLLEADGSKHKSLKGWKEYEPIIIDKTSVTFGIISIKSFGKIINSYNIHNIDEFLELTKTCENDIVDLKILSKTIISKNGLFLKSKGKKVLVINQVENDNEMDLAYNLVEMIKSSNIDISQFLIGSTKEDAWISMEEEKNV